MASRSYNHTKAVITTFLFTAGLFFNIAALTIVNEANAQFASGCAVSGAGFDSATGFNAADLVLTSTSIDVNGYIELDTGSSALDPNSIVIPFDQEISTVFLLENAGYRSSLGWFLYDEAVAKLGYTPAGTVAFSDLQAAGVTLNYLFRSIEDDQEGSGGDGIFDFIYDASDTLLWSGASTALTEA